MYDSANEEIQFPCPRTGEMVTLDSCYDCPNSYGCDIYASMADEKF